MSGRDRQPEAGVPPLVPAGDEQLGQQQVDDLTDPLSQELFRGQDEGTVPNLEGESGTRDGREDPPVFVETVTRKCRRSNPTRLPRRWERERKHRRDIIVSPSTWCLMSKPLESTRRG